MVGEGVLHSALHFTFMENGSRVELTVALPDEDDDGDFPAMELWRKLTPGHPSVVEYLGSYREWVVEDGVGRWVNREGLKIGCSNLLFVTVSPD